MVERTLRSVAKELAGVFYEDAGRDMFGVARADRERSAKFRKAYPTLRHYMRGTQVLPDGRIKQDTIPGWYYFIDPARKRLTQMLGDPAHKHLHDGIYKALCEDNLKATSHNALSVLQRRFGDGVSIA